jgi:hypothetical protein
LHTVDIVANIEDQAFLSGCELDMSPRLRVEPFRHAVAESSFSFTMPAS